MDKQKQYGHLSPEERAVLQVELSRQSSLRRIAQMLCRSHTTLSREVRRNRESSGASESPGAYQAAVAGKRYTRVRQASRRRCKLVEGSELYQRVRDLLLVRRYSPQQIAARLRHEYPHQPSHWVSHETIYATIYAHPRGALREGLIAQLRQAKRQRGRRRRTGTGGPVVVPEVQRIEHRPAEVERRELPGH